MRAETGERVADQDHLVVGHVGVARGDDVGYALDEGGGGFGDHLAHLRGQAVVALLFDHGPCCIGHLARWDGEVPPSSVPVCH